MGKVLNEGELIFDFTTAIRCKKFDDESHKMSHCMKSVDFIVEWPDDFWFVEVKDPLDSKIPETYKNRQLKEFIGKMKSQVLFSDELGPKAKDSFLYLHLGDRLPEKPIKYIVLLALEAIDPGLLISSMDRLRRSCCILGPDNSAWPNKYIEDALIFNERTWNEKLDQCPVSRDIEDGKGR